MKDLGRNLLVVANFDLSRCYGAMQRTRRVALGLVRRGWDVVVHSEFSQSPERVEDWMESVSVDIVPTEINYDDYSVKSARNIRAMAEKERPKPAAIERLERNHDFDWVWMPFPSHELVAGPLGRWRQYGALHRADVPVVVDVQGLEASLFRSPLLRFASLLAEVRELARCEGAVFVDRYLQEVLSDFVPGLTTLIPNGVDTELFAPPPGVDPKYLTFVGRLAPERGIWTFLKAARLLSGAGLPFRVVGNGPAFPAAVDYCRQHELPVTFLGTVPHEHMPRVYGESLAVVNPIHLDGISEISLEAMACGAVLVKSRNRSSDEVFEDNRSALLFPRGNERALAETMERVATDEKTRQIVSRGGLRFVRGNYSQEREIGRVESFLLNLSGGDPG